MSSIEEWSAVEDGNTHLDQHDLERQINPFSELNRYTKKIMAAVKGRADMIDSGTLAVGAARKLETARTISLAGDVAGAISFDGSADAEISASVTDATDATVTAAGTTAARALSERFADMLNAFDFGAKGDGITDDFAAIQAALDAAHTNGGGVVYLPAGIYLCSDILVVRSNTTVIGYGATLLRGFNLSSGGYGSQIWILYDNSLQETVCKNVHFYGVAIDGNGLVYNGTSTVIVTISSNGTSKSYENISFTDCTFKHWINHHALDVQSMSGLSVVRCKFLGFKRDAVLQPDDAADTYTRREAIQIDGSGAVLETDADGDVVNRDFIIKDCYFGPSDIAAAVAAGFGSPQVGVGGHSMANFANRFSRNLVVSGCIFDGCSYSGVHPYGTKMTAVRGCEFRNCVAGVMLTCRLSYDGSTVYRSPCDDSVVIGNTFVNDADSDAYHSGRCIWLSPALVSDNITDDVDLTPERLGDKNILVANNYISGFDRGCHFGGAYNAEVSNNVIVDCAGTAISGCGCGVKITGNSIDSCGMVFIDAIYWVYAKNKSANPDVGRDVVFSGNVLYNVSHSSKSVDIQEHRNVVIANNTIYEYFGAGEEPENKTYLSASSARPAAVFGNVIFANAARTAAPVTNGTSGAVSGNVWIVNGEVQE